MSTTTVRISGHTRDRLAALATQTKRPMSAVLETAVAAYERRLFWERFAAAVEHTAADPAEWAEVEAERRELEGTLRDNLDDDPAPRPRL